MTTTRDAPAAPPRRGFAFRLRSALRDPALTYLVRAVLLGVAIFGLLRLGWVERRLLLPFTAAQERLACALLGDPTGPIAVGLSCSAAEVVALCLGAVLAFPAPWRRRLAGAAGGMALIVGLNTLRIGTLGRAAGDRPLFELLHLYLWPGALIAAVTAFVFLWMRWAVEAGDRGSAAPLRAPGRRPLTRLALAGGLLLALYLVLSPWLLDSPAVQAAAGAVAAFAASLARLLGLSASSQGGLFRTEYGVFVVTADCVLTPLIPVYLAAALTLPGTARRRVAAILATPLLFFLLAAARLLVLVAPPVLVGSHRLAVHGFRQLLLGVVVLAAAAWWRRRAGWPRRALLAVVAAAAGGLLLGPAWTRGVTAAAAALGAPSLGVGLPDPQGALLLTPAYQMALFAGLWVAGGGRWSRAATAAAALALSQPLLLLAAGGAWERWAVAPGAQLLRAWALAAPLLAAWAAFGRRREAPEGSHAGVAGTE
ncbi:MAG: hypothetical protein R3325_08090 [Thermoanaerobaculia bacterium]|nr:hypothetical protein [Thermoanaerobaculia bacterium]